MIGDTNVLFESENDYYEPIEIESAFNRNFMTYTECNGDQDCLMNTFLRHHYGFTNYFVPHGRIGTRNNFSRLKNPFDKTNMQQKIISFVGSSVWNGLPDSVENANS